MEGSEVWISFLWIWISFRPDFDFVPTGFDFLPTDFESLPRVLLERGAAWTHKPDVKGVPSSRAERSDPGERRAPSCSPGSPRRQTRLKRRASLDALWRLAMTERPLPLKHPTEPCLAVTVGRKWRRKGLKRLDRRKEMAYRARGAWSTRFHHTVGNGFGPMPDNSPLFGPRPGVGTLWSASATHGDAFALRNTTCCYKSQPNRGRHVQF